MEEAEAISFWVHYPLAACSSSSLICAIVPPTICVEDLKMCLHLHNLQLLLAQHQSPWGRCQRYLEAHLFHLLLCSCIPPQIHGEQGIPGGWPWFSLVCLLPSALFWQPHKLPSESGGLTCWASPHHLVGVPPPGDVCSSSTAPYGGPLCGTIPWV